MISVVTRPLTIDAAWRAAAQGGHPAALWRLPRGTEKTLIFDLSGEDRRGKLDLEETPPGFALGPFLNPDGEQTRLLRADVCLRFDAQNRFLDEQTSPSADRRRVLEWEDFLENEETDNGSPNAFGIHSEGLKSLAMDETKDTDFREADFKAAVQQAVDAMGAGRFQKVVLSRTKTVALPAGFNVIAAFNRLCDAYPNAFVSAVSLPDEGAIWLGASPETLVSVDAQGIFRTVSLAGTQPAYDADGRLIAPVEARWSHKEIEEQALVSRYIIECFKKIRLREYVENGPKTVQAGNLHHLRTDFTVDTEAVAFPQLGTVMLDLLHPTSAVCGTPKAPALAFIQRHEGYDREWYSGFLGPVNVGGESHLFVNLRTMKIEVAPTSGRSSTERRKSEDDVAGTFRRSVELRPEVGATIATLYAGAGITEDSVPEREWRETELKCQTLLKVLG
jgi:isochorismate synthase